MLFAFIFGISFLSLVIKVGQVSFVGELEILDWKYDNYVQFIAFLNNILSLDTGKVQSFDSIMTLGSKVKSYTGETNGLQYRDLKEAYEDSTLIDINSVNINNRVTNLKDYDQQRNNISYVMSDDDIQKQVLQQELEKKEELNRIERLKQRDQLYFDQYKKIHKRLIG